MKTATMDKLSTPAPTTHHHRPLVDVGCVIQNAVVFNFRKRGLAHMNTDSLPNTVARFNKQTAG
jgi:hypothetical protein